MIQPNVAGFGDWKRGSPAKEYIKDLEVERQGNYFLPVIPGEMLPVTSLILAL